MIDMGEETMTAENGVLKTQLENGLTIVLKEMHHAPVTSFWVWYNVGSRFERPGHTGIAHWVEHMMFKGTPQFPSGVLDRIVSREGGQWNAFTWIDYTAYYETLPSDRIGLSLQIESDRMVNTIISPEETDSERTVIISERHMSENRPTFHLFEEVQAAAFRVHPYHHMVIGDETDLKTMTRDDLYGFYRTWYAPNNATVIVVGDFESDAMLAQITEHFGNIKTRPLPDLNIRPEPDQRGERQVNVKGPGDTSYLTLSYKSPPASSDDYFALALLNAAFTGGSALGQGGSSNKSSRLYKSLVSTQKAVTAAAWIRPTADPFLYTFIAIPPPGSDLTALEAALDAEIARLATEPITQNELDRARKRARVEFTRASESITGQARMIGMAEVLTGDYQWFETALAKLDAITLEDIERVRATYLNKDKRTVGRYIPNVE